MTAEHGVRARRWGALRAELARWRDAQRIAGLWLRDDDAVGVTPALTRLLELCTRGGVPCLIAAVPREADPALARYLATQPLAEVAAHGWSHANHAATGRRPEEFPAERTAPVIAGELELARARLAALFGAEVVPVYVPPWNRIAPEVAALLPEFGFRALSTFGRRPLLPQPAPLVELNAHLDIIDWRGSRGGRDPDRLAAALAEELAWAREADMIAVGVLTHHLVHDATAWRFLTELFEETVGHPAACWWRARDLIGQLEAGQERTVGSS